MTNPTTQALAQRNDHPAVRLQAQYASRLASLVPSHVNGQAGVRQATGALRDPELAAAAANDFGEFVGAVERAAVLGLRPGSEEYYLVPRTKRKGQPRTVMGIVGWQGLVELMYRSGAVASVVAEVVHREDGFAYRPGLDLVPEHEVNWDAEDRGQLRLVYAFARMSDGSVSKVVVLNRADIDRIKQSSEGASSPYSPWNKHEAAMWLKSAVRQLAKWVPTSVERLAQHAQAQAVAAHVVQSAATLPVIAAATQAPPALPVGVDPVTGEITGGLLDDEAAAQWFCEECQTQHVGACPLEPGGGE